MSEHPHLEVVDAEFEDEAGTALTLFQTSDPRLALARMSDLATVLVDVVRDRRLSVRISGRDFLTSEAWTTLGAMVGIVPVVAWTRRLEDGSGWEARVEARTLDGRLVGAAESMCSRTESKWARRDEFAIRSMAQTRAISRALRAPLGQVVVLGGYEPASAEEMPTTEAPVAEPPASDERKRPTKAQMEKVATLIGRLEELEPGRDWREYCRTFIGTAPMSYEVAERVIRELDARGEEAAGE